MRSVFASRRYANVASTVALIVALGGTSYAASKLTGKDIKDGSLTGKDVRKESLGSKQIKGLKASDFKGGLPEGPVGSPGPEGPAGSALAYARVKADGTLEAPRSQGIASLGVDPNSLAFCLNYTNGAPRNAIATADVEGTGTDGRVQITTDPGLVGSLCSTRPNADIAVLVFDDRGVYVAVIA